MRLSKLPLWYLIGVIVVVLVSLFNYLGMRKAILKSDITLVLRFQYMDFLLIGLWFTINIIILLYLISSNAHKQDYILPIYFIVIHIFYISIIILSYYDIYLSKSIAIIISAVTSIFELTMVTFFLLPYLKSIGVHKEEVKTNINKRKARPKKNKK